MKSSTFEPGLRHFVPTHVWRKSTMIKIQCLFNVAEKINEETVCDGLINQPFNNY